MNTKPNQTANFAIELITTILNQRGSLPHTSTDHIEYLKSVVDLIAFDADVEKCEGCDEYFPESRLCRNDLGNKYCAVCEELSQATSGDSADENLAEIHRINTRGGAF